MTSLTYSLIPDQQFRKYSNRPHHAKMCLRAYADSEGSDQPAHPRSLIRAFTVPNRIIVYYRMYEYRATARMILCACAGISAQFAHARKHFFAWQGSNNITFLFQLLSDFHSMFGVLKGLDTLGKFSAIIIKGRQCHDFLFAFKHTKPLLKRGLVQKKKKKKKKEFVLSGSEFFLFGADSYSERKQILSF